MEWAAKDTHLRGIPRRMVMTAGGAFTMLVTSFLNNTQVHNKDTLLRLIKSRPSGTPLITVSNHMSTISKPRNEIAVNINGLLSGVFLKARNNIRDMSFDTTILVRQNPQSLISSTIGTSEGVAWSRRFGAVLGLDDPLMWGFKGSPVTDWKRARWTLTAEDICFTNPLFSYLFRLAKCIPITRGAGIYQKNMNEALDHINEGEWLHTFPEGKISQGGGRIQRLKWGTASLIVRASVTPIVLPIAHSGFEKVMPEKHWFGRRPLFPLCLKNISIVVGQPMEIDLSTLLQRAESTSRNLRLSGKHEGIEADRNHSQSPGWPNGLCKGLDEGAQKWLFSHLSEQIQFALQKLYVKARSLNQTS